MGPPMKQDSNHAEKPCGDVSILAFQIYDQCKQMWCDSLGPWVSGEPWECILLETPEESDLFGRFLSPGEPVTLPDCVRRLKIETDSFSVEKLSAAVVRPVTPARDRWEVEVRATLTCRVRFYSQTMRPLPVRLLRGEGAEDAEGCIRPGLRVAFNFEKRFILYGGGDAVVSAGLPDGHGCSAGPHAFAELKADPLEFQSVRVEDADSCREVCDCNYEEPLNYIYGSVGFAMMLFLYQIVSLRIPSCGISIPPDCLCDFKTPCEQFQQMDFPPAWNAKLDPGPAGRRPDGQV